MRSFSARDLEIVQAIRRDDISFLMMTRCETGLECLFSDDAPIMFAHIPFPIMIAAYYGATKCFNYLFSTTQIKRIDQFGVSFSFIDTPFTLLLQAEI